MTGSGHEIKIHFLQYIFTTRLLARFHYVLSGFFRSKWDFSGQNEFLPTQHRLRDPNRKNHYSNNNYKKMRQMSEQARDKNA